MTILITNCIKFDIANISKIIYNLNMSVRKIKKSYISCTGYFASYKNKSQVAFESVMERDLFMILEFDNDVISYEEQPMQIKYPFDNNVLRRYTPDVLVTYKDNTQKLIEIKYASEVDNNKELKKKFDAIKEYFLNEYDLNFELFTDKDIDKQYLDNLKFLYKFAFIPADATKNKSIKNIISSNETISIKKILNDITANKEKQLEYIPYIWNYIFTNISSLNIDLYKKLTMASVFGVKKA